MKWRRKKGRKNNLNFLKGKLNINKKNYGELNKAANIYRQRAGWNQENQSSNVANTDEERRAMQNAYQTTHLKRIDSENDIEAININGEQIYRDKKTKRRM